MVRVDELFWEFRGNLYCHMTADSLGELHAMAREIGCKRCWFHNGRMPHYDLAKGMRLRALAAGAIFVPALAQARQRLAQKEKS